jgi:hypothetical protein
MLTEMEEFAAVSAVERAVLDATQIAALRERLAGRLIVLCFGAGVDSTAMMVALRAAGLRPDLITFADTGGERPESIEHLHRMGAILRAWKWPPVEICKKLMLPTTPYADLFAKCIANETLPSLAFGLSSCSLGFKAGPQDQFLKGAKRGPNARPPHPLWIQSLRERRKIVKLIGYDCGKADLRRAKSGKATDPDFDFIYPLQVIGWRRPDCVRAITDVLGADMVPIKSSCFFCPATKVHELFWMAGQHPELLERALDLERNALTGRHSRFDEVEFGAKWEDLVRDADRFPSTTTTVGLGRSFSWNQWARTNGVVDENFKVHRSRRVIFLARAEDLRTDDNAMGGWERASDRHAHPAQ